MAVYLIELLIDTKYSVAAEVRFRKAHRPPTLPR
jgi:hypothetical protein